MNGYKIGWNVDEKILIDSYRLNLEKIVIAPWLLERIQSIVENATYIPNGFDFDYFKLTNPIENRESLILTMLYHTLEKKGCKYGIEALEIVKRRIQA